MSGGGTGDLNPNPAWIDQRVEQYFLRSTNILRKLKKSNELTGELKVHDVIELAKIIQMEGKYGR